MAKAEVKIFLNLEKYTDVLADTVAQRVNTEVAVQAKKNVRTDTHRLQNSIRTDKISDQHYETSANAPHALAQEFGRPDLNDYGYTPYMRPAAVKAVRPAFIKETVDGAEQAAKARAKVG